MSAIFKMADILNFQVAGRVGVISIPMGITVPNFVLVSQFARFFSYPLHYTRCLGSHWWNHIGMCGKLSQPSII